MSSNHFNIAGRLGKTEKLSAYNYSKLKTILDLGSPGVISNFYIDSNNNLVLEITTPSGIELKQVDLGLSSPLSIKNNVDFFSDLSSLTPSADELAYVRFPQGTSWLPGSLGGTYYGPGLYIWTGTAWVSDDTSVFSELENLILGKVDKNKIGWVIVKDTVYTSISPLPVLANTKTQLVNNAGVITTITSPDNYASWWNPIANTFNPDVSGDDYDVRVSFTVDPTMNNRNLDLCFDIPVIGTVWEKSIRLKRGAATDTKINEVIDIPVTPDMIGGGCRFFVTIDGNCVLYDISLKITKKFSNS